MSGEERLQLEQELLMTCSKAQAINKYINELEESSKLSELWCKSQQENQRLKERVAYLERSNDRKEETIINLRMEQELDLYKSVLNEVREYIKNNTKEEYENIEVDEHFGALLKLLDKVGGSNE